MSSRLNTIGLAALLALSGCGGKYEMDNGCPGSEKAEKSLEDTRGQLSATFENVEKAIETNTVPSNPYDEYCEYNEVGEPPMSEFTLDTGGKNGVDCHDREASAVISHTNEERINCHEKAKRSRVRYFTPETWGPGSPESFFVPSYLKEDTSDLRAIWSEDGAGDSNVIYLSNGQCFYEKDGWVKPELKLELCYPDCEALEKETVQNVQKAIIAAKMKWAQHGCE